MDKILYSPKEGTTGFWGLLNVPEEPNADNRFGGASVEETFNGYNAALESCKSNKLEIVNPELLPIEKINGKYFNVTGRPLIMKSGVLLDIPIGYEFKEEETDCPCTVSTKSGSPMMCFMCEGGEKVLRLVKTETQVEHITVPSTGCTNMIISTVPQPEPEESQTELERYKDAWNKMKIGLKQMVDEAPNMLSPDGRFGIRAEDRNHGIKCGAELTITMMQLIEEKTIQRKKK